MNERKEGKIVIALRNLVDDMKKGDIIIEDSSLSPAGIVAQQHTPRAIEAERKAYNEIRNYVWFG